MLESLIHECGLLKVIVSFFGLIQRSGQLKMAHAPPATWIKRPILNKKAQRTAKLMARIMTSEKSAVWRELSCLPCLCRYCSNFEWIEGETAFADTV